MLEFAPAASAEFKEAVFYYESALPGTGERFSQAVDSAIQSIIQSPQRYAIYEAGKTRHEYRRVLLNTFPYLIVYQVQVDRIRIVAVAHASRAPGYWEQQ